MSNLLCNDLSQNYPKTSGLADYPFQGVWKWFWGALDPTSIEAVITQIAEDINYNTRPKCYPFLLSGDCYRPAEVERILIAYAQLVEKRKCNEYTDVNPNQYNVTKAVSDALSTSRERVQEVLNMLLWGTKSGRYKGGQVILKPLTNSQKTGLEEIPQSIKDESLLQRLKEGSANTLDTALTIGKWALIGGGVLGVLYVANMVRPFLPKGK